MIAEEAEPVERLPLRFTRPMADHRGGEILDYPLLVGRRMHRTGAHRLARAFFGDRREARRIALARQAHRAMMLAVAAAAGGQSRLSIRAEKRDNQHPAEDRQQR